MITDIASRPWGGPLPKAYLKATQYSIIIQSSPYIYFTIKKLYMFVSLYEDYYELDVISYYHMCWASSTLVQIVAESNTLKYRAYNH